MMAAFKTLNLWIVGFVFYHCATTAGQDNKIFFFAIFTPGTNDGCFQNPEPLDSWMSFLPLCYYSWPRK